MSNHKWHSGPPPHVGWWMASRFGFFNIWRWWDGFMWSDPVGHTRSASFAATKASQVDEDDQFGIYWSYYYPKNARVQRIKP